MTSVVRFAIAVAVALAALLATPAHALDTGDIIVERVKGEVHATMNGVRRAVRAGSVLELPATLRTGGDGAIDLAQGATTVRVGPDTLLEFPAPAQRGAAVDRIVQPRGNAFYDIGKRQGRKLRVETPYLVGVIKGTQFNVAVTDASSTISLFEGRLEVLPANGGEAVDLNAGEIASRNRDDKNINVIKMDANAPGAPPRAASDVGTGGKAPLGVLTQGELDTGADDVLAANINPGAEMLDLATPVVDASPVTPDAGAGAAPDESVDPGASVDVGAVDDVVENPGTSVGPGPADDIGEDVGGDTDVPDTDVSEGADEDVSTGAEDVGAPVDGIDDEDVDLGLGDDDDADDDDGNNGHGNDDDGHDDDNPGNGRGRGRGQDDKLDLGDLLDTLQRRPGRQ